MEAERRQLTVLFCDLVDSTALSQKLDPEDLRDLMQAYQRACGAIMEKYEGHIAQYLGDGLMVYFGWPRAHEDDAVRAIRAGLEAVKAVSMLKTTDPLRARVGIHTGLVVVGATGGGDASIPKAAVGDTPNIAARLQAHAGPDSVVVSERTSTLARGLFQYHDLGTHNLKVFGQCKPRHRHQEFISFLNHLDNSIPGDLDVHLIVDNYATHKHAKVRAWLAKRARYHLHFTPTYASWINQVERWFAIISQRAIRRGSFRNVRELIQKIEQFIKHYNQDARPFKSTATADSNLAKINKISKVISGTAH